MADETSAARSRVGNGRQLCDDRGVPDCQSGAAHSMGCGTIICIAAAGDTGIVTSIVIGTEAAMRCTARVAAVVGTPVSFR